MRLIFGLVLVLGLGLAGFAVYMAQGFIAQTQEERDRLLAEQQSATKLVNVVVVNKSLKYGQRVTAADFEVVKMQEGKTPAGFFNAVTAPMGKDKKIVPVFYEGETRPRAVLRSYEAFEPVVASKLTEPGVDAGITANLTPGMRALAIKVDVSTGVSGFLRPGDRVDIYWTGKSGKKDVTKLIHTAVRLIAIDQSADADRTEETDIAKTVTVEASPKQVAELALAQNAGRLTLSLVGTSDVETISAAVSEDIEIDRNGLLGIEEQEIVEVEPERVCTIRTNKGGEIVEVPIPCTN